MEDQGVEGEWDILESRFEEKEQGSATRRAQFATVVTERETMTEGLLLSAAMRGEEKSLFAESLQTKDEKAGANASTVEAQTLLNELHASRSEFDNLVLALFLAGTILLLYSTIPAAVIPFAHGIGMGLGAAAWTMWWFEALSTMGTLSFLVNMIILVPFNILNVLLYAISWPVRMLVYQALQFLLIPLFSHGKVVKYPWKATFPEFLKVTQGLFDFFFEGMDPKLKPFENIDDATVDQAVAAFSQAPLVKMLNRMMQVVPKGLLNSLAFRIIVAMLFVVTIGWWWVGWNYMPLLPLQTQEKPLRIADDTGVFSPAPTIKIQVTECKWLKVGRKSLGEGTGRAKCLNE